MHKSTGDLSVLSQITVRKVHSFPDYAVAAGLFIMIDSSQPLRVVVLVRE